jgi:hypothetical protein
LFSIALAAGCGDGSSVPFEPQELQCTISESEIFRAQVPDGIPALTDPRLVLPGDPGTEAFRDVDRVVGVVRGDEALAVPLNIFWWHEIVNVDLGGERISITHCPLTGSSIGFDRSGFPAVDFGVSGLLYRNNLVMYDRSGSTDTLWPQMSLGARCGAGAGSPLPTVSVVEMTYGAWVTLHPDTRVVSTSTGHDRIYEHWAYPYGSYDSPDNSELLFPLFGGIDPRRPPKERVLGVRAGSGGIAYPFGALAELGSKAVVQGSAGGQEHVVFWDEEAQGALAFHTHADGQPLTFAVSDDRIVDLETGSTWGLHGIAIEGAMEGRRLEPISDAFVAFWFAWPRFFPDIEIWES